LSWKAIPLNQPTKIFGVGRKIAIKDLAILQTGDLAVILRYRHIFSPHRIDKHTARRKNGLCLVYQPSGCTHQPEGLCVLCK